MEKLELQLLSGLHAGAKHPLSAAVFTLGGGEDADLRLLDDEFEHVFMRFTRLESGGFALEAEAEYRLIDAEGRVMPAGALLQPGQFLQVGEVWLTLQPQGAPLQPVPALQAAGFETPAERDEDFAQQALFQDDLPGLEALSALAEEARQGAMPMADDVVQSRAQRSLRRKAAAGCVGGVLILLVLGLGFAWLPSEAHTPDPARSRPMRDAPDTAPPTPPAAKPEMPREQAIREAVAQVLERSGLKSALSLRVGFGEIHLAGALDRVQIANLEQALGEIEAVSAGGLRISAQIDPTQHGPQIRIREVVPGRDGWIVTDSGQRIILGGEVDGYRLLSIDTGKIVLMGRERVEIQL